MTIKREWVAYGALGLLLAGVYATMRRTGGPGTDSAGLVPRHENGNSSITSLSVGMSSPVNMLGIDSDGSLSWSSRLLHTFHPLDHLSSHADYKHYVRHRYPTITGTNINTLIHRGYSPLMVPSNRDYDWFTRPPGDDEFSGGF